MYPGALLKTVEHTLSNPLEPTLWATGLVLACERSTYSNTPWIDERSGERNHVWPQPVAWRCLVLLDDRLFEWILDDDDRGKSWMLV